MAKYIYIIISSLAFLVFITFQFGGVDYKKILYPDQSEDIYNVEVDVDALKDIDLNLNTILKFSKQYNISPEAIMGVIIAERSLHKGPANQFEEYFVQKAFLEKPDIYLQELADATKKKIENRRIKGESEKEFKFRLGHGLIWTIGLCQISIMKSLEIDSLISVTENQPQKSVKENIKCLMKNECSIKYCAFEFKSIRDSYKKRTGIDISDNIGILCTLYNTGKVSESIVRYNKTKLLPQSNNFGKFVEIHSELLAKKARKILLKPHNSL